MASTADRLVKAEQEQLRGVDSGPAALNSQIYLNCFVSRDASGNLVNGTDLINSRCVGVGGGGGNPLLVSSLGASGSATYEYSWGMVLPFNINSTNLTAANIGQNAVIFDNDTVTNLTVATNDIPCGLIRRVVGSLAYVQVGIFGNVTAP